MSENRDKVEKGALKDLFAALGSQDLTIGNRYNVQTDDQAVHGQIEATRDALKPILTPQNATIIEEIKSNPVFAFALGVSDENDPIKARSLSLVVPLQSNEKDVREAIRKQANTLMGDLSINSDDEKYAQIVRGIEIALNSILRERLQLINSSNIIRTDIINKQKQGEPSYISPAVLKSAIAKVAEKIESGEIKRKHAILHVMEDIGVITADQRNNKVEAKEIIKGIALSIEHAHNFLRDKTNDLNDMMTDLYTKDPQLVGLAKNESLSPLDLNATLPEQGPFDLLEILFSGKNHDPRSLNDIQAILTIAFHNFRLKNHPLYKKAKKTKDQLAKKLSEALITPSENNGGTTSQESIYKYEDGEFKLIDQRHKKRPLRTIEVDGHTYKFFFDGISVKEAVSLEIKAINNRNFEPEDLFDLVRARFVTWDFTTKSLKEENNKEKLISLMKHTGEKIGLTYAGETSERENLKNRKFCISGPSGKTPFKKWTLYGRMPNGVGIEIQFLPKDVHEISQAKNSPLGHKQFKFGQILAALKKLIPHSISPSAHTTINHYSKEHQAETNAAEAALERALASRPDSDAPAEANPEATPESSTEQAPIEEAG